MTGRRLVPCPWPWCCGDCAVFVSLCQGTAGGPCPQDLLCAPKHRLASSSSVFMPLYKQQRICRMVFLYVPFKRPSFGFPLLPALALQPPSPRGAAGAGATSPASGSLSQSSLRMYMSPSCSPPRLRSQGCVRAEGRGGALPGSSSLCWCSAPQWQGPCISSSPLPPRMQEPLWLPASVSPLEPVQHEGGRVQGHPARASGGQGVWGSKALCPLSLPSPGRETLGSWPCYFSITE